MATQFEIDCALLAGASYISTRPTDNRFPIAEGWSEVPLSHVALPSSFEAVSFQRGSEIVISYAGTSQLIDWLANVGLGAGLGSDQLEQAALYYLQVRQAHPTATITFTGHSLGGGLAALMGVMFDEQVITFDQAPFANSASSGIRDSLKNYLNDNGYSDSLLATLAPEFLSYAGSGTRTANVTGYFVQGEALQVFQPSLGVLGTQTILTQSSTGMDILGIDLHSQALLSAFFLNNTFRTITFKLPELLKMVFDSALYEHATSTSDVNFMEHLIRHQTGTAPGVATADQMLDRFTADLQKVAQEGGFTLTNTHITNTLVAFAMQMYYENPEAMDSGKYLFTDVSGGIRFDRTDVAASLADAKGWQLYFQNYLAEDLTLEEHRIVLQLLPAATDWFIQAGSVSMSATADASKAFMVGGIGADWMAGGSQADLLIGNAGDDTLDGGDGEDALLGGNAADDLSGGLGDDKLYGGEGDDTLTGGLASDYMLGGEGYDTYTYDTGDGFDTINDSNGKGKIVFDGSTLDGGTRAPGETVYTSRDGKHTYLWQGHDLLIDSTILVEDFKNHDLGIHLKEKKPPFEYGYATSITSPLVLDLDGDGVETTAFDKGAYFDHAGEGLAEDTGWAGKDDGILVLDKNGNGLIDNGNELFGNQTTLAAGGKAANGFEALRDLDFNADGKISAADTAWSNLRIWKDANGNAYTNSGELLTLEEAGVAEISLTYQTATTTDAQGNEHRQEGSYTLTGGQTRTVSDVWFKTDLHESVAGVTLEVPSDVAVLPFLVGAGNVFDLHQAIVRDGSGELKSLTLLLVTETDPAERERLLNDLLASWTGNQNTSPTSRGEYIDGRKLAVLEKFVGEPFVQKLWGSNPGVVAAGLLMKTYGTVYERYYAQFSSQTFLKPFYDLISLSRDATSNELIADLLPVVTLFRERLVTDPDAAKVDLVDFVRTLKGDSPASIVNYDAFRNALSDQPADLLALMDSAWSGYISTSGNDVLSGSAANDILIGGGGNDSLYGESGNDTVDGGIGHDIIAGGYGDDRLIGGEGDDKVTGDSGNDTLDGGTGNDELKGNAGNDVYLFKRGDGSDTIQDVDFVAGNTDTVRFAAGIAPSDVTVSRDELNLYLSINNTNDRLTLREWFFSPSWVVERVEFADGTVWGVPELTAATAIPTEAADYLNGASGNDTLGGLGGNDVVRGNAGDDALDGDAGNDTLDGGAGKDTLDGGVGYDKLQGGAGNDMYLFERGDGYDIVYDYDTTVGNVDTIRFAEGISPADVTVRRDQSHLYMSVAGFSDRLTLQNWFDSDASKIERVEFVGGTVWDRYQLTALAAAPTENADYLGGAGGNDIIAGLGGNDTLIGGGGNDTLNGGVGNDSMEGCAGNDVYLFKRGDGADTVNDHDTATGNTDTIRFDFGIAPGEVIASRDQSNLYLSLVNTTDRLTVLNWFSNTENKVEQVEFADGTVWGLPQLSAAAIISTENADYLPGGSGNDSIAGLGGNDSLYGSAGNDTLDGGSGYDELQGEDGHDVLNAGKNDDYVVAGAGDDTIDGGTGFDSMEGGAGNDVYLFKRGDGADTVNDYDTATGNTDTIRFDFGIAPGEVTASRDQSNLYLSLGKDRITLEYWFNSDNYKVERVEFSDGTVWGIPELTAAAAIASEGSNYLGGTIGNDSIAGLGGNDTLFGDAGSDTLDGGVGNDSLYGAAGNDVYLFERGDGAETIIDYDTVAGNVDTIRFAAGIAPSDVIVNRDQTNLYLSLGKDRITLGYWFYSDSYKVERVEFSDGTVWGAAELTAAAALPSEFGDYLSGAGGNDSIIGLGGNDTLVGNAGDDTLEGGAGNDSLQGGAGNDVYLFKRGDRADTISDNDSTAGNTDTIRFAAGITTGDVTVSRDQSHLYLSVADTSDRITVQYWYTADASKMERVEFADGTVWDIARLAVLTTVPSEGADYLGGTSVNDAIGGLGGNDTLRGNAGNDTLEGGLGNDLLDGGTGNDLYLFQRGDGADRIIDNDTVAGNVDTIRFAAGIAPSDVIVNRDQTNLYLSVANTADRLTVVNGFSPYYGDTYKVERVEFADGTVWGVSELTAAAAVPTVRGDYLSGTSADDSITGLDGNDTMIGGAGGDTLDGGAGDDTLDGGAGNDVYLFKRGDGFDLVADYDTAAGNVDTIRFAAGITPDEVIVVVEGGFMGYRYLTYSDGADRVLLQGKVESVQFADGTEWDAAELANRIVQGPATEYGDIISATPQNDVIDGLAGDDEIYGKEGNDLLYGGGGNDSLEGHAGVDILLGGAGNDVVMDWEGNNALDGGDGNDYVWGQGTSDDGVYFMAGGKGSDELDPEGAHFVLGFNAGDGEDVIYSSYTYAVTLSLGGGISAENLTLALDDHDFVLTTGAGDSIRLDGLAYYAAAQRPIITLQVIGTTIKTYDFSAAIVAFEAAMAQGAAATGWPLAPVLATIVLSTSTDRVIGGELAYHYAQDGSLSGMTPEAIRATLTSDDFGSEAQAIEVDQNAITGTAADDMLQGTDGNDLIEGGAGNDTLSGGLDIDTLIGGTGDDTYIVDNAADIVTENAGEGTDLVQSGISYTLGADVESLTLTGTAAIDGTGNELDNYLTGNSANNVLTGGGGADTMGGGMGDDIYFVDNVLNLLIEAVNEGIDSIKSSVTYTLVANVENLTLTSNVAIDGTGNELVNVLRGNSAANILTGGAGDDTYVFGKGSGQDTVNSYDTTVGKVDTVLFDTTVAPSEVLVSRLGNDLVLSINGTTDTLTIQHYLDNDGTSAYTVEQIKFFGEAIWDVATVQSLINKAPVLTTALPDKAVSQGEVFNYVVPAGAFTDPDAGDTLTYSASLADGSALPSWLSFNAATRTFGGTPSTPGTISVLVTAMDARNLSASDIFDIDIASEPPITLIGGWGADTLNGGAGNDVLYGMQSSDVINGHAGNDTIDGGPGNDTLTGGEGDDVFLVEGDSGSDTVNGGTGFDEIRGSDGDDIIRFANYTGDNMVERIDGGGGYNRIVSGAWFGNMDFSTTELVNIARIEGSSGDNQITGNEDNNVIAGGTGADRLWGLGGDDVFLVEGDSGSDTVNGGTGFDEIRGSDGDDIIRFANYTGDNMVERIDGGGGYNCIVSGAWFGNMDFSTTELVNIARIEGSSGGNQITGSAGDDVLWSAGGSDWVAGGLGNDTYILGRGDGKDTIVENDSTVGNTDVAQFLSGIAVDQIWFQKSSNNLEVSIIGTSDKFVVRDWYLDSAYRVEQFQTADDPRTLLDSNVQNLVNAMASFAPPAAGQTTLPTNYQDALAGVIAANWQ